MTSELQLDETHELHALFAVEAMAIDELSAHANFVAAPPLLLELHAAENEATEASASAARLRKPIMKVPPV